MGIEKEVEIWYAMRATYRREPDAMHLLKKENLGCFIPMQYKICIKKGKKVRALVPVVHNLLFVHARPSDVQRVKSQVTYLQYITDTRSGQKIIVPDSQMQRFIAVSGTYDDHLLYFQPDELNLSKGTKVRITGGEFEGQEGIFLKVKGARDRRVVIEIQGVIAVAMAKNHWYHCRRKIGTMNKIKPYKEQYSIMKKATEPMVTYTNNRKSSNVIADARDDIRCVIFSEEF